MSLFSLLVLAFAFFSTSKSTLQSVEVLSSPSTGNAINGICRLGGSIVVSTTSNTIYSISLSGGVLLSLHQLHVSNGGLACSGSSNVTMCLYNSSCFSISDNRGLYEVYRPTGLSYSASSSAVFYYKGLVYAGMFRSNSALELIHLVKISSNGEAFYSVSHSNFQRRFVSGFGTDSYLYFAVEDPHPKHYDIRLLRICKNNGSIDALYELHLKTLPKTNKLVNAAIITISENAPIVVFTMASEGSSGLYWYRLSTINNEMELSFINCLAGDSFKLPWDRERRDCDQFDTATPTPTHCNFNKGSSHVEALHMRSDIQYAAILEMNALITASIFFKYHSVLLLYVAYDNTSLSSINKYLVYNETDPQLLNTVNVEESVYHFDYSLQHNVLIASSNTSVYFVPLDDCSNYDNCHDCTQDFLCGWCVVENKCSSEFNCDHGNLTGHWIQEDDHCPYIEATMDSISTDSIAIPLFSNGTVPAAPDNEQYICLLENPMTNFSYNCPFINGSCQISSLPSIDEETMSINIHLQLSSEESPFVSMTHSVLLVNCSKHINCTHCVSRDACGWCVDDMTCSGGSLSCTTNSSWYPATPSHSVNDICPYIQVPDSHYKISISSIKEVLLVGYNIPQSSAFNGDYICYMFQGSSVLEGSGAYHNSTHVQCSFTEVNTFSDSREVVSLSVTWSSHYSSVPYKLEIIDNSNIITHDIPALLYNCSVFGGSCTSCVERSQLVDIDCVWCDGGCHSNCINDAIDTLHKCPQPTINLVYPLSGSISGGTILTLYVHELPLNFYDILSVDIGSVECSLIESSFVSGSAVSCETGPTLLNGLYNITLLLNISGELVTVNPGTQFLYENVKVARIVPVWGPIAGGTLLTITGSYLYIGNPSLTYILVAGKNCTIIELMRDSMTCRTDPVESVRSGSIEIVIDGITVSTDTRFQYRTNPMLTRLVPNMIIPAGDITLSFYGNHMASVYNPLLVIKHSNLTYIQYCVVNNDALIQCRSPSISDSGPTDGRSSLSYVLVLDNINITGPPPLELRPNPAFSIVTKEGPTVTIRGEYIDSVLPSEIEVTIQEEICVIESITATILTCIAPEISYTGSRLKIDVIVTVANYSVNVGQVEYSRGAEGSSFSLILVIIIVSISFVTALMMLLVAVAAVKYWKAKHPPLQNLTRRVIPRAGARNRNKIFELSLQPSNHYCDVIERSTDGENIYDTINDNSILYENQHSDAEKRAQLFLPLYSNNAASSANSNQRPVSDLIPYYSSSSQLPHHNKPSAQVFASISSPDLSSQPLPPASGSTASVTALLPGPREEKETEAIVHINAEEDVFTDDEVSPGPLYSKINKKLTPIQEDSINTGGDTYSKLREHERRPKFLTIPQEEYIPMHSVAGPSPTSESSQPPPLPPPAATKSVSSDYVQMVSAATTPQEGLQPAAVRPESSYVVMRSVSVSSETAKSPSSQRKKHPSQQGKKTSLSESEPDVFLTSSDYVDIQPN
ncbi:PREDICTED: plexin A3-like [Amphimedon queenslandica]|uniref:Sema domain-containing protein n=1 Tax=Amphimedon queenslandica TaxID=400682 RepID=A0A1X7VNG5_AMPQE|nr:PREDICTED: plexin A3-like [Amphimedon queenslandica]|eukprot:XP_011409644.2 PREDICTED: plexin A3-like [Amphimedon queenslandica]